MTEERMMTDHEEELARKALARYVHSGRFKLVHVDKNQLRGGNPCMAIITPIARLGIADTIVLPPCVMEDYGVENALWEGGPSCYIETDSEINVQLTDVAWVDTDRDHTSGAWGQAYDRFEHGMDR